MEHKIVSEKEFFAAHAEFLSREKEHTRQRDELARRRRELPWRKIEKEYTFEGPEGKVTLSDLFQDRSQLIVQHFMMGPTWDEGCEGCSFMADHVDAALVHLRQRDVRFVAVSRAPLDRIRKYQKRMGWRFPWYSSEKSDFNFDFHVSFDEKEKAENKVFYNYRMEDFYSEEMPGMSVFLKGEDGTIYHTYSSFGRGTEQVMGTYMLLDLLPKGRDEEPFKVHPMEWVRRHDEYDTQKKEACCH